ncbi:MAG: hypothetical protein M1820_000407 [Bogoriella megaspora]|nr:MAG: hypothetical protein M1820_000407 [Bogoriella megaspora]
MPHARGASESTKLSLGSTFEIPNTKVAIPKLGFGVYLSNGPTCTSSCLTALQAGYRHIDSAQYYDNEAEVGRAILESGIPRSEIFVTTKILSPANSKTEPHTPDEHETYLKCIESLKKIAIGEKGYVDLFLIHSPHSGPEGRKAMWKALERLFREGRARSIGVSNFGVSHIEGLKVFGEVWPPHVNQIELHPWCQQRSTVEYCQRNKILIEAYCPIVRNEKADDKTLLSLSKKYNKSTGQILIRYSLQKGWIPLPKSDTPSRIEANADVYDFNIDKGDMQILDGLDRGKNGAIVEAVLD